MQWDDEENFHFIWDSCAAFVRFDRDRKTYRVLSYHEPEALQAISAWLNGLFRRLEEEEVEELEEEEEVEEFLP